MFKTALKRAALGLPLGITIGFLITIAISLGIGDGKYYAYVPQLADSIGGGELNAVMAQTALCAVLGAVSAGASVVWEIENWSLMKQSLVFFALLSAVMMPVAYLAQWMEHSLGGFLSYFAMFTVMFIFVWIVRYFFWRGRVRALNKDMKTEEQ